MAKRSSALASPRGQASRSRRASPQGDIRGAGIIVELARTGLLPRVESPVLLRHLGKTGAVLLLHLQRGLDLQGCWHVVKTVQR